MGVYNEINQDRQGKDPKATESCRQVRPYAIVSCLTVANTLNAVHTVEWGERT